MSQNPRTMARELGSSLQHPHCEPIVRSAKSLISPVSPPRRKWGSDDREWLTFAAPLTLCLQLTPQSGFLRHQRLEFTGGLAHSWNVLEGLSLDPGKVNRLELLVSPRGLAWLITSSLGTPPLSLPGRQSQGGEECSHQAIQHSS